jgi:hypothetical protein
MFSNPTDRLMSCYLSKTWHAALRLNLNVIGLTWCDLCVIEPNPREETISRRDGPVRQI